MSANVRPISQTERVSGSRNKWRRARTLAARLDGALFAFAGVAACWLAYLLLREGIRPGWPMLLLIAFWVVFSYLLLPRLHRILTRIYVPGYFIGRTRTSDGLLGDPVNLALRGRESQVHQAMTSAGWTRADDLTLASGRRIATSTLARRSYPSAPVSPLTLFDRQQDFAYEQQVAGSPSKRHHVRFWRCPEGWMLPGGYSVEWLAAGTYDRSVGVSIFTFQVTHKVAPDTDTERDHIVATVRQGSPAATLTLIEDFSTGYHSHNGGGDLIETDGDLPILDLSAVVAADSMVPDRPADSRDKRPAHIVFGAVVTYLRAAYLCLVLALSLLSPELIAGQALRAGEELPVQIVTGLLAIPLAAGDVVLATAAMRGRNWARIWLMLVSVVTIVAAFVANAQGVERVGVQTDLWSVTLSILVLLALSSHRARDFAIRASERRAAAANSSEQVEGLTPRA